MTEFLIKIIAGVAAFIILLLFFGFVFEVRESIATHKLHHQKSWVWYALWAITTAPVWAPLFLIGFFGFDADVFWSGFFSLLVLAAIFWGWYWSIAKTKTEDLPLMRFAAGAVGKDADKFDFSESAESVAARLMAIKNYVSVIGIYGFPGFGKSSFARMIIESFSREEILYTYISLTETNAAKDFSALFATRWLESLKEKYPKIDTTLVVPFMQSILRETGNGIIAPLFSLVPGISKGLLSTKAKEFDPALPAPGHDVKTSDEIANVFGNVPEIKEKLWIVMIDEIERARFDEIYRVTEIIERFKNEGRTGVPVHVMFILCISDAELRRYLQKFKASPLAHLVRDFFFHESKSLTIAPIYLPPVSYEKQVQYFKDKLLAFNDSLEESQREEDLESNLRNVFFDTISRITSYEPDESKRLSRAFGLIGFSPRLIARCVDGLYFTFGVYRKESTTRLKVRMSDLLIMEYIRIKYPHIMLFFSERVDALRAQFEDRGGLTAQGVRTYFEKKEYSDSKRRVADLVADASGKMDMSDNEKNRVEDLIAFASFWAYNYWDTKYETSVNEKIEYLGTLSDPHELWIYLRMIDDGEESPYARLNALYTQHGSGQLKFQEISLENLHDYARFLIDVGGNVPVEMHLDVLKEIARRLTDGEIEIQPSNVGDTVLDTFVFDFSYTLLVVIEFSKNNAGRSNADTIESSRILDEVFSVFAGVLKSKKVTTGGKFMILNSFANDTRGSGSTIHGRFASAIDYMLQHDRAQVERLIAHVFGEYKQKYFTGKKSIYDNEENFFYVMYQGWSGKKDNTSEIESIRKVAERGLAKHTDALELYWNRYSAQKGWRSYKDIPKSVFEDVNSNALYMPLATLVKVSKGAKGLNDTTRGNVLFWTPAARDSDYVRSREVLNDSKDTLRYVLVEKKLLQE